MSLRTLPALLAAIEEATAPLPELPPARILCARPGCLVPVVTAISPYCTPECARRVASWVRGTSTTPLWDPQLTPAEQALRTHLVVAAARRRQRALADVRHADEQPSELLGARLGPVAYLDEAFPDRPQDARVVPVDQLNPDGDSDWPWGRVGCDPVPVDHRADAITYARLTEQAPGAAWMVGTAARGPEDGQQAFTHQPADDDPVLTGRWDEAANGPTAAKPRPRPRPPWWRRWRHRG